MRERDCECEGARCGEAVEVMVECEERRIRDLGIYRDCVKRFGVLVLLKHQFY